MKNEITNTSRRSRNIIGVVIGLFVLVISFYIPSKIVVIPTIFVIIFASVAAGLISQIERPIINGFVTTILGFVHGILILLTKYSLSIISHQKQVGLIFSVLLAYVFFYFVAGYFVGFLRNIRKNGNSVLF